jgi:plastocyanin
MKLYRIQQKSHPLQLALLIGVLLLANAWLATAGEIRGVVTDKTSGKPVEDAVVFIIHVQGQEFAPPTEMARMDQINRKYVPHVLPVLVGTAVTFPNKDQIDHHLYSNSPAKPFERPLYKGTRVKPVEFNKIGVIRLGCDIHPAMSAIVLALQNPYFAKTDPQGKYTIENVTPGSYKLAVWHEFSSVRLADTVKVLEVGESQPISVNHTLAMTAPKRRLEKLGDYDGR